MKTIWKYELKIEDEQEVVMPAGSELLHVGVQRGIPCLWALGNPNNGLAGRTIYCRGTGHRCDAEIDADMHIGTTSHEDGALIFHWFH